MASNRKTRTNERCSLCGYRLFRGNGKYAGSTPEGRSHATEHHFVAERFFGRSKSRPGTQRDRIFAACPWGLEGLSDVYCYECHELVFHNPVLTPEDVEVFAALVRARGLGESTKPGTHRKLIGRIMLFREIIAAGLASVQRRQRRTAPSRATS